MSNMHQLASIRMPDGREVQFVDWNDMPLYSSADILAGSTDSEVVLFSYVEGRSVVATSNAVARRAATEQDTNIAAPGTMSSTEEFLCYGLRPEVFEFGLGTPFDPTSRNFNRVGQPNPTEDRLKILQAQLNMSLQVSEKIYHRAGFGFWNTGFGPSGITAQSSSVGTSRNTTNQGLPSQEAVRSLGIPVHIGQQEKYQVKLENAAGAPLGTGTFWTDDTTTDNNPDTMHTIRVYLTGLYKRPVA